MKQFLKAKADEPGYSISNEHSGKRLTFPTQENINDECTITIFWLDVAARSNHA